MVIVTVKGRSEYNQAKNMGLKISSAILQTIFSQVSKYFFFYEIFRKPLMQKYLPLTGIITLS